MLKLIGGFIAGIALVAVAGWQYGGSLMFQEYPSPYGLEETAARIQQNIIGAGWALSGLRDPSSVARAEGNTVPGVLLVEACKVDYSAPILMDEQRRILSILMPCKVSVYEKADGKVYMGIMNTKLMGKLFGPMVADIMDKVSADQQKFITFDPSQPAPQLIRPTQGGGGPGKKGGC